MKKKDVLYRLTTKYVKTLFRTKQKLCQNFKTMSVKNDPAQKKAIWNHNETIQKAMFANLSQRYEYSIKRNKKNVNELREKFRSP